MSGEADPVDCAAMRRLFALGAAALGTAACMTYGQEVARIRQGLLGLRALDLRECLPVPSEVKPQGATEIAIYRWEFTPRTERARASAFDEPPDPGDPDLSRERRRFLESGERPRHMAYCQLSFELRDGRVQSLAVEGRDRSGLNAESDCIMQSRDCVAPPAAPAAG
jgi:hypothetical protein